MRVQVVNEIGDGAQAKDWSLYLQWCRYIPDDGDDPQTGYRFIWKHPVANGKRNMQPARGQARIPSFEVANALMAKARAAGWGDYQGV